MYDLIYYKCQCKCIYGLHLKLCILDFSLSLTLKHLPGYKWEQDLRFCIMLNFELCSCISAGSCNCFTVLLLSEIVAHFFPCGSEFPLSTTK